MSFFLMPGTWVLLPSAPEWGLGQVQSATGYRVTVNFEHAGKVLVNTAKATLQVLEDEELDAYLAEQESSPRSEGEDPAS